MTRLEDTAWNGSADADDYLPDWFYTLGKVIVTVAAFAVLIVLAIGYVVWIPFRMAWRYAEHRPKSKARQAAEFAALALAVGWIVNLWRPKRSDEEKAYREGYQEAATKAAREEGKREGERAIARAERLPRGPQPVYPLTPLELKRAQREAAKDAKIPY